MPIEVSAGGGTTITGENSMDFYRANVALQGLKLKAKTGMEPTRHVRICKYVREHYGLKAKTAEKLIPEMESYIKHNWPNARSAQ